MNRIICHLDLDYFYAQVEEVENLSLKQLPVLICVYSGRTDESGVISTANYIARKHGIKSGMPISLAKRRLEGKNAVFIPMNHEKYEAYSERIMDFVRSRVDTLEQAGIDEAFFEMTSRSGGDYEMAAAQAREIKNQILLTEKLTCSMGMAPNKIVAKIASDFMKPDGFTVVRPDSTQAFLYPLSIDKLYGVGPKTSKILKDNGISSIEDLAKTHIEKLQGLFDKKMAAYLHNAANGVNDEPVTDKARSSQLSRIITLKVDIRNVDQILVQLSPALKDLHGRLVTKNLLFKTVSVIGIPPNLSLHSKSKTLEAPTNDYSVLERTVTDLLTILVTDLGDLRRVGVRVTELISVVDQSSLTEFMT